MSLNFKIPDDLEEFGSKMEKMGKKIEEAIDKLGLDKLSEKIGECFQTKEIDREQIKKRIKGLVITQKALPINKLANAMDVSELDAENLIYELVADGIDGVLEAGVFKYLNTSEEILSKLNDIVDNL